MTDLSPPASATWERLASRRLIPHTIAQDGVSRTALLYVPMHIRRRGGYPLMLVFHGGASNAEAIAKASAMHRLAEEKGFMVAYPMGTRGASGLTWKPGGRNASRKVGDARFVRRLVIDLQRNFDIDGMRIFLAGFSVGGSLVYELAALMADRIAGVAVVSGTMLGAAPAPSRPVPLIHIHGTQDRRVPFAGGRGPATSESNEWPPVEDGIAWWRDANICTAPPVVETARPGIVGTLWRGAADVELWLVDGGGHFWPGGWRDPTRLGFEPAQTDGFSASEEIWRFFSTRPRRRLLAGAPQAVR